MVDSEKATVAGERVVQTLRGIFGFEEFRPNQEPIVEAVMTGRDVFAVMPTGGGKSLCYQLPAHLLSGTCIVISPLISLMKDQVDAAKGRGLRAEYLNSSQSPSQQEGVRRKLDSGGCNLLYVAPERFAMSGFSEMLKQLPICLFAIDEAHCISDWGHDFRPDYLELASIVKEFPHVPVAAFTATATLEVQADIIEKLGLREPLVLRASFNRPNLTYHVIRKEDLGKQLLAVLGNWKQHSGIIYRSTRNGVEETAEFLSANGIPALPYHAGLDSEVRKKNQEAFIGGQVGVVVATIAFGMGIDKPDIRFVIHGDLPKNIEGYYQETGRAGRDGRPARCILYFDFADISKIRYFINKIQNPSQHQIALRKLDQMVSYGARRGCRRRYLLSYFGERYSERNCGACDVCTGQTGGKPSKVPLRERGDARRQMLTGTGRTLEVTWDLVKQGLSHVEIARRRALKVSTVFGHLEALVSEGRDLDVDRYVSPAKRQLLEKLFARFGTERLKPVVEAAEGKIAYADARLVRASLQRRTRETPDEQE